MLYLVLIPLVITVLYATHFSIAGMGFTTFVTVGPIAFVGLIIPNMVTAFYGDDIILSIAA